MEPRGCNPWQSAANRPAPETTKTSRIRCDRLPLVDGKEGVDGSSPSEGFAKFLLISSFCCPDWRPFWASTSTERPPHDRIVSGEAFELCW